MRSEFRRVIEQQALGVSVPEALQKMARRVPATETNFFAIVIEIQTKAGGNLSEAVANLSKTVRDRKKMRAKIGAMSMEALASAAIIGAVPFLVSGALYVTAPNYMSLLFIDEPWPHRHPHRSVLDGHRRGGDEEDDQFRLLRIVGP